MHASIQTARSTRWTQWVIVANQATMDVRRRVGVRTDLCKASPTGMPEVLGVLLPVMISSFASVPAP
jgi:hypothetical protein